MKKIIFIVKSLLVLTLLGLLGWGAYQGYSSYQRTLKEKEILQQIAQRLRADTRIAEVLVTGVETHPTSGRPMTTIKFLEYDTSGRPLQPRYFTFAGNIIQFQSLVVRFADDLIERGDALRGKSVYLFWKAFVLDGQATQEYEITKIDEVPAGYRIGGARHEYEQEIWRRFWEYALNTNRAVTQGIKNAQLEAPGTKFVPGILYTLKIEHDGGIRIDTQPIPAILRGETIY